METKSFLIIFFLVLPIIMFGETLNKQEVYLSKDKTKISLIEITETHERNRTTIVADTVKNLYPSENARAYMTQRNAEILMNESNLVWLPDSLVPRSTHLFGKDIYERYSLEVVGDTVSICFKSYCYKPVNKGIFYFTLVESIIFLLASLLGVFLSKTKASVQATRWIVVAMFVTFFGFFFMTQSFTFIDNVILNLIAVTPAFIVTFLFNKRIKRFEAENVKI